jgi:hypothetical protein
MFRAGRLSRFKIRLLPHHSHYRFTPLLLLPTVVS